MGKRSHRNSTSSNSSSSDTDSDVERYRHRKSRRHDSRDLRTRSKSGGDDLNRFDNNLRKSRVSPSKTRENVSRKRSETQERARSRTPNFRKRPELNGGESRTRLASKITVVEKNADASVEDATLVRSPHSSPVEEQCVETTEDRIQRLENMIAHLSRQTQSHEGRSEAPRLAVRSDCIPEFSPGNNNLTAQQWLVKIDQLKAINHWDEIATIYHMQSRLVGVAKTWYHSLRNYNLTWEEWKALIKRSFPDHTDYATLLQTMLNRKKLTTESMTSYYFGKMELIRSCEISGKQAVSCLIHGIDDSVIQNSARAGRYHTPEALYEEYLSALNVEASSITGKSKEKILQGARGYGLKRQYKKASQEI
ncbi:hypothetical protein NQ315_012066 [Exocentrus adspersus]|uniref:Retrotransposon gag domain-containing protein n=1 Tax=Exocentrus adspersus TaxID=1586481 RepID=A0AAV8VXJ8_9CUCU|nr:hypothetical protein NQ315_012066 [Exocentrus adspersus]